MIYNSRNKRVRILREQRHFDINENKYTHADPAV